MGYKSFILTILTIFLLIQTCHLQDTSGLDKERIELENNFQSRIDNALSKLIDPKEFVAIVNVELIEKGITVSEGERRKTYILPGVPERRKIGEKEEPRTEPIVVYKYSIKRIIVTLTIDTRVPDEKVSEITDIVTKLVGLNAERGDELNIKRTQLYVKEETKAESISNIEKKQSTWKLLLNQLVNSKDIVWILVIGFVSLILTIFLFGPLRKFFSEIIAILPKMKVGGEITATGGFGGRGGGVAGGSAADTTAWGGKTTLTLEKPKMLGNEETPFSFIEKKNIDKLNLLIKDKTPEQISIIINYLQPELASEVLSKLDPKIRAQVLMTIPWEKQFSPEEVTALDKELRRNINYLVGGTDVILNIYETADKETQKQMMQILNDHRPDLAEKIRQRNIEFEDLIQFDKATLRTILREIPLRSLAMALKGASEELKDLIFETLPEGMVQILKEEIEFSQTISSVRIEEEQRKIIQLIRRLQDEGRVEIKPIMIRKKEITEKKIPTASTEPVLKQTPTNVVSGIRNETVKPDFSTLNKMLEQRRLQQQKRKK
jgi:flagellar motor switch protein FliG